MKQIIDAVENANKAYIALYDPQTSNAVYLPDEIITGERGKALEELIENSPADRFLHFSTKYEIYEYSIMESFIEFLPSGAARQELAEKEYLMHSDLKPF